MLHDVTKPTTTRPDPKVLARMRSNIGRIASRGHAALEALERADVDPCDAIDAMREESTNAAANTVTVLLHASHDARPAVRAAAASAMSCHPYGALIDRLAELDRDADAGVREAAHKALDDMHDLRPGCLSCGRECRKEEGALELPAPDDPHATFAIWPVFCSAPCAVEYALDRVQERLDEDDLHACLQTGEWAIGSEEDCDRCQDARFVGRPRKTDDT